MAMGVGWVSRFDDLRMDEMLLGIKLRIVTRLVMKSARKIMLDLASARLWMSRLFIFICFAYHATDCVGGKGFSSPKYRELFGFQQAGAPSSLTSNTRDQHCGRYVASGVFLAVRSVLGDFITNFCRMLPFQRILRTASLKVHLHVFGVYGANDSESQAKF